MRAYQVRFPVYGVVMVVAAMVAALLPLSAGAQEPPADRSGLEHACPRGDVPDSGFADTSGNTHEHAIDCASWWEITRGGPGGLPPTQYGPTLPVYRDQMASFIARMIDESDGTPLPAWDGQNRFGDVESGNVHMQNINRLQRAGVVQGRSDTEYAPKMIVRRDQMASFIARAIHYVSGVNRASDTDQFADVPADNPHRQNINGLAEEGVVQGRAPGVYAPADDVRRDAMASFVMRGLDLHVEEGDATPPEPRDPQEPPSETSEETPEETPAADDPEPSRSEFASQTAAPELQRVEVVTTTDSNVSIRYTFDQDVRSTNVVADRFRLYGIDSQYLASSASRQADATAVVAVFTRAAYDAATTAAVAFNAVQNIDGSGNPERGLGLKGRSFPAGSTSAPDLLSLGTFQAGPDNTVDVPFVFDSQVTAASTSGNNFGLVLANGTERRGNATAASPNSTTVTVRINPDGLSVSQLEQQVRRAFTANGAVTGAEDTTSPRRAIDVVTGGITATPNLIGVTLNKTEDRVIYTFDRNLSLTPAPTASNFAVYYLDGTQRNGDGGTTLSPTPPEISNDRRRVTVHFQDGAVNDRVVGASIAAGAVTGLEGTNGVDSEGVAVAIHAGHVLGPRLLSVSATAAPFPPNRYRVTWTFDKSISSSDGELVVYRTDGARVTESLSTTGVVQNCSTTGSSRACDVQLAAGELGLGAATFDAVENSSAQTGAGGTVYPNYEQSRPFT